MCKHMDENDKFIILASDGIWEFMSSQEAVLFVSQFRDAKKACEALVAEARGRWEANEKVLDDITCTVIFTRVEVARWQF